MKDGWVTHLGWRGLHHTCVGKLQGCLSLAGFGVWQL